jgi:hypothetical protein
MTVNIETTETMLERTITVKTWEKSYQTWLSSAEFMISRIEYAFTHYAVGFRFRDTDGSTELMKSRMAEFLTNFAYQGMVGNRIKEVADWNSADDLWHYRKDVFMDRIMYLGRIADEMPVVLAQLSGLPVADWRKLLR